MGFSVRCDRKECRKEMEPVLDKKTGDVYCVECGLPFKDQKLITQFAKAQMVSLGQVKRDNIKKQAYSVKCAKCEKEAPPVLNKKTIVCSLCGTEIKNLSKPFMQMLKIQLKSK